MSRKTAHLTRQIIEGISAYSPYRGARLNYLREYDPNPTIAVDLITVMDIKRAIESLYRSGILNSDEVKMLSFVMMDGRLSRRDISKMIQAEEGIYIDQRTISKKLSSAYIKIADYLGWEFSDSRMFQIVAKKMGHPAPYLLNDEDIDKITQIWSKV